MIKKCPKVSQKAHIAAIRNVVEFASEVRVHLRDRKVVVGSIVLAKEPALEVFEIRPWGLRSTMVVRLDDVLHATPVWRLQWADQQRISSAQRGGVFMGSAPGGRAADRLHGGDA